MGSFYESKIVLGIYFPVRMVNRSDDQNEYGSKYVQSKSDKNGYCYIFYCQQGREKYQTGTDKTGKICFHMQAAAKWPHGDKKQEKEEAFRNHAKKQGYDNTAYCTRR